MVALQERREYINPDLEFRFPRSQILRWFGPIGLKYIDQISSGRESEIEPEDRIEPKDVNDAFFERFSDNLGLPPDINPRQFARDAMHTARECLWEARHDRLGVLGRELDERNETVFTPADDIARHLYFSVSPHVDETLAFEHRRRLTVGLIIAYYKAGDIRTDIDVVMTEVLDLFDRELFAGDTVGEVEMLDIYTLCDNDTGQVIYPPVHEPDSLLEIVDDFPNCHIKHRVERVRYCRSLQGMPTIPVIFDIRRKPDLSRVLKVLRKVTLQRGSLANLEELVRDQVGISFTPQDLNLDADYPQKFMDNIIKLLEQQYGPELKIEEDNETRGELERGEKNRLFRRFKITIPGNKTTIEILYHTPEQYEQYHTEAFRRTPDGQLVFGQAHEGYKLEQDAPALAALYPKRHFGVDTDALVMKQKTDKALALLTHNRVDIDMLRRTLRIADRRKSPKPSV